MDFWTWISQLFSPRSGSSAGAGLGRGDGSSFSTASSYRRDEGCNAFDDSYFNNDKGPDGSSASADSDNASDSGSDGGGSDGGGSD